MSSTNSLVQEKSWISSTNGLDTLSRMEFVTVSKQQTEFVPCVKGILSNHMYKLIQPNLQSDNPLINNDNIPLNNNKPSNSRTLSSLLNTDGGSFFTSVSNSEFDGQHFEEIKNKFNKQNNNLKEVQEILMKSLPSWFFVQPNFKWSIKLHGERGVGKTAIQRSLCRMNNSLDQHRNYHSDTLGMSITNTLIPIKLLQGMKWLELEIVDVGEMIAATNSLYHTYAANEFNAHVVLFSMSHYPSFKSAKNKIKKLQQFTKNIICVATKVDEFQKFQVTDVDIEEIMKECNLNSICFVNSYAPFGSENSVYTIIEELVEILLNNNPQPNNL
ncbi:hypothetical protein ABK040_010060 [Willaertia magna]